MKPPTIHLPPSPPPWWGLRGRKFLILITLDRWKRNFPEKNYIENYFCLLKSTTSTKTASQKCWRNIIQANFFGRPYRTSGIKTRLGSPMPFVSQEQRKTEPIHHKQIFFGTILKFKSLQRIWKIPYWIGFRKCLKSLNL